MTSLYAPTLRGSWPEWRGPTDQPASCPSSSPHVSTAEVTASDFAPWNEHRVHTSTAAASACLSHHRRLGVLSPHRPACYASLRSPLPSGVQVRADRSAHSPPAPNRLLRGAPWQMSASPAPDEHPLSPYAPPKSHRASSPAPRTTTKY